LQSRTAANLAARERVLAAQTSSGMPLNLGSPANAPARPADMRAHLDRIAASKPADPNAFTAAREDLRGHFNAVRATDEAATRSVAAQIATLQSERDQLYRDMVSQIARDAQRIAGDRHLSGPALTAAVRTDLLALRQ
ncbi:MAG TPA: hypothetical protein VIO32_00960, partial [Candidatus Baltobacteraceae bacterium]